MANVGGIGQSRGRGFADDRRTQSLDDTDRRIIEYLENKGKATSREIAYAVGVDRLTVNRHLNYLEELGEVEEFLEKGHNVWWINKKRKAKETSEEGRQRKLPEDELEFKMMEELESLEEKYECPECGKVIEESVLFCTDCGFEFEIDWGDLEDEEEYRCPYCGNFASHEDLFCPKCGLEFKKKVTSAKEVEEVEPLEEEDISLISVGVEAKKGLEIRPTFGIINGIEERERGLTKSPKKVRRGLINGLTNGLTNGLGAVRVGITNGVTNGNGIINGLGSRQDAVDKKKGIVRILVAFSFLLLMLISPLLLNVMILPEDRIRIDGDFSDWSGAVITSEGGEAAPFNSNADIVGYGVDGRLSELSFYVKVDGHLFDGEPENIGRRMDSVYIFIDADQSQQSGYQIEGIGADFMVKVEGWQGEIFSQGLYEYTTDTQNWDFWEGVNEISSAAKGSELEVQVGYEALGLKNHDKVDVLFHTQGYDGFEDFSDTVVSNEKGVLIVDQQGVGEGFISGNANMLLRLDLKAINANIIVTEIRLTRIGVGSDDDISAVRLMDGGDTITTGTLRMGVAELQTNIILGDGDSKTLYVEVDVRTGAQAEDSIGFRIANLHDVTTSKGTVTIRDSQPNQGYYDVSYLTSIPQGIIIDGAFADWATIFLGAEPSVSFSYFDAVCKRQTDTDTEPVKNRNVDIAESRIVVDDEDMSFYFSVHGNMMAGARIPAAPNDVPLKPEPGPPGEPTDVPEPQPTPIETKQIRPELVGEDTACIFLDTDDNVSTGYNVSCSGEDMPSFFGADWMIKITGKFGLVRSGGYYKFNGLGPEDWKWEYLGTVPTGNDARQLETQIENNLIGFEGDNGLGVCIYVHDWDNESKDYSDDKMQVSGGRSTAGMGNVGLNGEYLGQNESILQQRIWLRAGTFDPLTEEPDVDQELVTASANGYYIVQFRGPILESWKDDVSALGGKFYGYITKYAFIVGIDDAKIDDIKNLTCVRWVGIYQPAYKAQEGLFAHELENVSLDIVVFENMEEVSSQIENLGGEIKSNSASKLRVRINRTRIKDILYIPDVEWVEKTPTFKLSNNVSDDLERLNVNSTWKAPYYLNGTGQIVGVCDTGLDTGENDTTMHDDFEGRIVKLYDLVGGGGETAADMNSGHGTHVAGSVLGNGTMSSGQIKGMAYGAKLVFQAVEDDQTGSLSGIPSDLNILFQQAYNDSARIHTNSWTSSVTGEYTSYSQDLDEFTWANRDMVILFCAGNDGTDADSDGIVDLDSILAPATAKNCITVGASENYRSYGGYQISYGSAWPSDFPAEPIKSDLMSNNSNGMVAFSSRGATDDGRIKPDVVAPGTNVLSTRSSVASGTLWGVYDAYYVYSGGTSMSTPLVAGCAALVRQYYVDREGLTSPSGALIKATLINGATDMPGQYNESYNDAGPVPNFNEGWGRANLTNSIYPTSPRSMIYEDVTSGFTASGKVHTYKYPVESGSPLKITLVWTDYPGTPTSGGLVNDLNLNVTAPDGTTYYYGNDFTDGWSDESHTFDDTNNTECVYIQSPQSGTYTVEVIAQNIAELGSQTDQEYALVLSGDFQFGDDVGVETLSVNKTQLKDSQAEIKARIKNFGSNNQTEPFDIRCVITNPSNTEVLNETKTINSLLSLSTINLTWYHTPALFGQYTVYVRTELSSDQYNDNNASTKYMMVPLILGKLVTMTGTNSNDLFGFNVTSGHLNNDNYQDLIVGAPGANRTYIFYGSPSMSGNLNAADADVILTGPDPNSRFGWSVGVSDVTGDGYDDVIVGAPAYNSEQGRVHIYHSSSTGLVDTIADVNITGGGIGDRFGNSVSGAGDVNGADNEDVIIGAYLNDTLTGTKPDAGMAYVFFSTSDLTGSISVTSADLNLTGVSSDDYFGFSVSFAGDVNNDAYDDMIIGAPGACKAYIYYGWEGIGEGGFFVTLFEDGFESGDFIDGGWTLSSPAPVVTTDHPYTGSYAAGGSVAIFGANTNTYSFEKIIDTSGYENIVVAYYVAVEDDGPGTISFVASYSMDGGENWIDFEAPITDTNNIYIAKIWDLSGIAGVNNNPDFAVRFAGTFGGMAQSPSNCFWVDDVSVTGTVIPGTAISNVTITGENTDDEFGWAVSSGGNVNGDSYDDMVIGAPDYDAGQGRAYVFFGANYLEQSIFAFDADVKLNHGGGRDKFGYSVGSTDLGGDSYDDILIGAPYNDTMDGSKSDAGAIYIFNGSSSMPDVIEAENCTRYGENANDHFGWSVSDAKDVNGDNYGNIIVGAPHYDSGAEVDAGRAYVLTIIPEYPNIAIPIILFILAYTVLKRRKRGNLRRR